MNKSYHYLYRPFLTNILSKSESDILSKFKIINTYIEDENFNQVVSEEDLESMNIKHKILVKVVVDKHFQSRIQKLKEKCDSFITHYALGNDQAMLLMSYPKKYSFIYRRFKESKYSKMYTASSPLKLAIAHLSQIYLPHEEYQHVLLRNHDYFREKVANIMDKSITSSYIKNLTRTEYDQPIDMNEETYKETT